MNDVLYKIGAELLLERKRQESIAVNLAGSSIPGYRREFVTSSSFQQDLDNKISDNLSDLRGPGSGVKLIDFTPGVIQSTGRPLDFAILGDGFFQIDGGKGKSLYTRNGSFTLSPEGELITHDGRSVAGTEDVIKFAVTDNPDQMTVDEDGTFQISENGEVKIIGKLKIVSISDPSKLKRISANYFGLDNSDKDLAIESTSYKIVSKNLEKANLSPVREMAQMIKSLREFEMNHKVLRMTSDILDTANRTLN